MPTTNENTKQIKSRQRVADYGKVLINPRKVNAMLDLVRDKSFRLDSRILELVWSRKDNIKKVTLKLSYSEFNYGLVCLYFVKMKKLQACNT